MADPNSSLDLRLTPDWLKESGPANRYADFEGDNPERRRGGFQRPGSRRDDNAGRRRAPDDRPRRGASDRRGPFGARPSQADQRRPSGAPAYGGSQPSSERPDRSRAVSSREESAPIAGPTAEPAPVQIDFLPEERAFGKIIQQIKSGHIAYPLFGLARMFLERPERHRVRIRSLDNSTVLYQLGDHGPVAMEAAALERIALSEHKNEFYETEVIEKEPIKGNFTSVARCTLSGRLLGPTNYHTFQTVVRSLYEQRFSRRMSFEEYRRTIESTTDPDLVNQWKEDARKSTVYKTKAQGEETPETFDSLAAVEQHFRAHHLNSVVKPCLAAEISGDIARHLPDRGIVAAIRVARDRENRFPAQIAGALRHGLNQAGLHVFKHKKRILYISTVRPQLFSSNQTQLSTGLAAVLATLRSYPKITRKQLAEKVLTKVLGQPLPNETSPEYQQAKTALAGDLIWLAKAGHIIEFADGTLDLPLPPKALEEKGHAKAGHEAAPTHAAAEEAEVTGEPEAEAPVEAGLEEELRPDSAHQPAPLAGTEAPAADAAQPESAQPGSAPAGPAESLADAAGVSSVTMPGESEAGAVGITTGDTPADAAGAAPSTAPQAARLPEQEPSGGSGQPVEDERHHVEDEPSTEAEWVTANVR
ncbi:MAG: hypothetical protein JOY92_17760 [Verrucomicrobia bacterium]|nr:hypothetical protein [Verrucomicrobiota bacterium]